MTDDLIRAANSAVVEMRRQLKMPVCSSCDLGDEGSEVFTDLVGDLDKALSAYDNDKAREKAFWYEGVADDLYQRGLLTYDGLNLMHSWASKVRRDGA